MMAYSRSQNPSLWKTGTYWSYSQYPSCWWPGDTRSRVISSHGIDQILPKYSSHSVYVVFQGHGIDQIPQKYSCLSRRAYFTSHSVYVVFQGQNNHILIVLALDKHINRMASEKKISMPTITSRDSPTVWPLCAFFSILSQFYVPFWVKKKKNE